MISVYELKPKFQGLLRPLVNWLAKVGVTANQVTVFALLLSIASTGFAFSLSLINGFSPVHLLILPLVWLVRMALNAIDGMLAREHHQKSALGCFLNEACDVAADAVLFIPFLLIPGVSIPLALTVLFLFLMTEVFGLIAPQIGASRRYDGPMGKSDRALYLSIFILSLVIYPAGAPLTNLMFTVFGLLAVVTMIQRTRKAIKEVQHA
ncbi:MAG: CDP-alcohol phosphatidyltransferase family protein [Gammaproteobacteria bacterium]|nr:CDP-alcohol phosphatidyltransferase family protein [Gammaproteobacteria bacterium]